MYNAFRAGLRSLGDDALRMGMMGDAVNASQKVKLQNYIDNGMSAADVAKKHQQLLEGMQQYMNDFAAAYPKPNYQGAETLAYGTGRKLAGVGEAVNNFTAPVGGVGGVAMQAAFMAPMLAPMFQQQTQPSEEEMYYRGYR